jgi:CRP-like cAMP-binding protein
VACNALHSVEARFCRWLLTCHDRISTDTVAVTQEFLADMLGVQRTTVTAVARSLQEKTLIRYRRGVVEILDRAGLQALSCECYGVVRNNYQRLLGR